MRQFSYLNSAVSILKIYNGDEPFHLYLKKYFSANKRHGSKDRKWITSLCYNYSRLGLGVSVEMDIQQKLVIAFFLCEKNASDFLAFFKSEWNNLIQLPVNEKIKFVKEEFDPIKIFPFSEELSNEINLEKFNQSFLIQPKLFIRIRPGFKETVINKIKSADFLFEEIDENCLAFSNNEKISDVIDIDKESIVQDCNSQRVSEYLELITDNCSLPTIKTWDCCAASGGKSILAYDVLKNIELTVSDKRKNILENLHKRFAKAGIKNYKPFVLDLSLPVSLEDAFDFIIADVPCSGSGTWARTPEQLTFFRKNEIEKYASLQKKIIKNTVMNLKQDGYYLYITCSVFKKENEENVAFIREKFQLNLLKMEYLKGYEMQADTLFAALLRKA